MLSTVKLIVAKAAVILYELRQYYYCRSAIFLYEGRVGVGDVRKRITNKDVLNRGILSADDIE